MKNASRNDATYDADQEAHTDQGPREAYVVAMLEERWEDSAALLAEALEKDPTWVEGHTARGIALANLGRKAEAEVELMEVLRLDPHDTAASFNLGWLNQASGEHERALSWYKHVLTEDPADSETLTRMGECALSLGRRDDARAFLEEALRLSPHLLQPSLMLAQMCLEDGCPADAEGLLNVALTHHPDDVSLRYTLALVLELLGRYSEALPHLHAVVTHNEHDDEAFYHLGRCAALAGLGQEAEAFLAQAVTLNPENVAALYELGRYYAEGGKVHLAVGALEECLGILKKGAVPLGECGDEGEGDLSAAVLATLGRCYRKLGRDDLAREAWERSLAIDPHQERVRRWLQGVRSTDQRTSMLIN